MPTDFETSESKPNPPVKQRLTSVPVEVSRRQQGEPGSLLEHVRHGNIAVPRNHRAYRAFFRFLKKVGSDVKFLEQVHRLRDAVILSALRERTATGGVTVALTGVTGEAGTSTLSLLLGLSLGECTHRRVAIFDGRFNMQRFAFLSEFLGLSRNSVSLQKGSNDIFAFYNESYPNIYFLRNAVVEQSMQFFSDKRLGLFLAELRKNFDFTIIDLPPLLKETASVFSLPFVDRLYLVAEAEKSRLPQVERCIATARDAGGRVSGVILSKQQTPLWSRLFWREFFY